MCHGTCYDIQLHEFHSCELQIESLFRIFSVLTALLWFIQNSRQRLVLKALTKRQGFEIRLKRSAAGDLLDTTMVKRDLEGEGENGEGAVNAHGFADPPIPCQEIQASRCCRLVAWWDLNPTSRNTLTRLHFSS